MFNRLRQQTIVIENNFSENFSAQAFVEKLLIDAIQKKASDIHFESYETHYRVRFRLDGLLHEVAKAPVLMAERITACLKVMAHLDTAERRLPQDGRFKYNMTMDCRISTCPTVNGEKVVIRLLHGTELQRSVDTLGLNSKQQVLLLQALRKPQGMILVTGPTGSGKTVTLYTALNYLNDTQKNISTVEDPVEIKLSGINQVGVNMKAGLNFAKVIRAFLRQDPDVIMVGEIRDLETAQIAVTAAQTGHLVLSTLHANGAVETLSRLAHIGIPWFQIADAVQLIVAQRLVRRVCQHCQGTCCAHCHQGYSGRIGLFEILPVTPDFVRQVATEQHIEALNPSALYESGLEKIQAGLTTQAEIDRVIGVPT